MAQPQEHKTREHKTPRLVKIADEDKAGYRIVQGFVKELSIKFHDPNKTKVLASG